MDCLCSPRLRSSIAFCAASTPCPPRPASKSALSSSRTWPPEAPRPYWRPSRNPCKQHTSVKYSSPKATRRVGSPRSGGVEATQCYYCMPLYFCTVHTNNLPNKIDVCAACVGLLGPNHSGSVLPHAPCQPAGECADCPAWCRSNSSWLLQDCHVGNTCTIRQFSQLQGA